MSVQKHITIELLGKVDFWVRQRCACHSRIAASIIVVSSPYHLPQRQLCCILVLCYPAEHPALGQGLSLGSRLW